MEKCYRCKKVVNKGRGYPMIDTKIYCKDCYNLIKWKAKQLKREELRENVRRNKINIKS